MAVTPTKPIELGFKAPPFELPDPVNGETRTLDELKSDKATVIVFMCNHCPYVKHILEGLFATAREYKAKGVSFIAINSNDAKKYPEDSPEKMKALAVQFDFPFPYLFDETQEVAKAYDAACTPDFNVFNGQMECVYRGQFDESRPGSNTPVTGRDLRAALDAILEGREVSREQLPSVGCSIKWKE